MNDDLSFAAVVKQQLTWGRWWLMASYLYYHRNVSLFRDEDFDKLSALMVEHQRWKEGLHTDLIDDGMLVTGSGYSLKVEDYPRRCVAAAEQIAATSQLPLP